MARSPSDEPHTGGERLASDIARFVDGPRPRYQSRLEPLHELVEILGPAWDRETDPATPMALARALEVTHERLQERLKPDETAEGRAFATAHARSPAADHNAQSIVIHSLHRPGAPGLDRRRSRQPSSQPVTEPSTTTNFAGRSPAPQGRTENEPRSHHGLAASI